MSSKQALWIPSPQLAIVLALISFRSSYGSKPLPYRREADVKVFLF
jgi:hypothetical protein